MKRINRLLHEPGGLPAPLTLIAASSFILFCVLFPAVSHAVDMTGMSRTYLQSRETEDGSRLLPLYEHLNLSVDGVGAEALSFQFGGWLRYDLQDNTSDKNTNNDLQYAYVSYKHDTDNAVVNLGRVMVFEGVAAERVDGVYARTDLVSGFGVSAYGGNPVETGVIKEPGNNVIYGARVTHQMPDLYRVGVSYLKEEKGSKDFRKEEGIDLWVRPVNKVEIQGRSGYNSVTEDWMEHTYFINLGPFDKLRFITEGSKINYKDYFSSATSSVFKLQPGIIDPNEKVGIVGEEVQYALLGNTIVSVDYKNYNYSEAGSASYAGGKVTYSVRGSMGAGISVHRMAGETDKLKYTEYRLYGYKKIQKLDVTLDLLDVSYDEKINGVDNAFTAVAAAGYNLTEKLRIGADVEYSKNPDFDKDVRAMIKLFYRFDVMYGKGKGV